MRQMRFFTVWAVLAFTLASCSFHSTRHAFGPYSEAENFYKKGNFPKAIAKYQEYLSVNPQGNMAPIAEYYIAKSYLASGNAVKARENFEQVMARYPQTSWADFSKEQLGLLQGASQS